MRKLLKKRLKIIFGSLLGLGVLLFLALVVHIAIMVKAHPSEETQIQMARTDFQGSVDSLKIARIQDEIKGLAGVRSTYFNPKTSILIYTFDNRKNTAQNIYDRAIKTTGLAAKRYVVPDSAVGQGCPVIDNSSFYGKLTTLVTKVVE